MIRIGLADVDKQRLAKRICKITPNMLQSRLIELAESDIIKELPDYVCSIGELLLHIIEEVEKDEG